MMLGEMLVKEGLITKRQFDAALAAQSGNPNKKIGEIMLELNYINIDEFTKVLYRQLKEHGLSR